MIEVVLLYDLVPGTDQKAYVEWAKKAIGLVLSSPGVIEFRASRNLLGSPFVRSISVWKSLADWQRFFESPGWQACEVDLRGKFAAKLKIEIWGPSPVAPEPLRPKA
jgi:heme-degrading monooxygenase HmoA